MINLERSELASMYMEAMNQLDGLEIQSYVSTLMGSTGDEPQCLPITHSSMYPLWSGDITPDHVSSSTRYRWRELYVAWKLETHLPDSPKISDSPRKGQLYTQLMEFTSWTPRSSETSLSTANMMCFCARKYSNGWWLPIHPRS